MLDFQKYKKYSKFHGIESLKYVREIYTPVCNCGDISTPRNVTLNETNCDWLFDMSVNGLMGGPWPSVWRSGYARLVWQYSTSVHQLSYDTLTGSFF